VGSPGQALGIGASSHHNEDTLMCQRIATRVKESAPVGDIVGGAAQTAANRVEGSLGQNERAVTNCVEAPP
jgi:hypothetical protein